MEFRDHVGPKSLPPQLSENRGPKVVTGHKPMRWDCGEDGRFSSTSPEKKASGSPAPVDQNHPLIESLNFSTPVMRMTADVIKPLVGSSFQAHSPKSLRPMLVQLWRRKKGEGEWLVAGKFRRKR